MSQRPSSNFWGTNWPTATGQQFPAMPDYWGNVFTKKDSPSKLPTLEQWGNVFKQGTPPIAPAQVPPMVGTDFSTGQRDVDLGAVPPLSGEAQQWLDAYRAMSPLRMQEQEQASRLAARLSQEQMLAAYPVLSQAAAEATARNLGASQAYQSYLQSLPNAQQARMASAVAGEAAMLGAVSQARDVASRASKGFRGQYISYG